MPVTLSVRYPTLILFLTKAKTGGSIVAIINKTITILQLMLKAIFGMP
jgi:hypothetical protein